MNIPKHLMHIWVGPYTPPTNWMNTWIEKHPDWNYTLIDNEYVKNANFHNQAQIDAYCAAGKYAGAADLIRYEVLYRNGGFIPPSDAVCLNTTDELWIEDVDTCYTVYENEIVRPGFVSPIYACNPGHKLLEFLIDDLHKISPQIIGTTIPWKTTGNEYLAKVLRSSSFKVKIFPSHYFIPQHYSLATYYSGPDTVYANQKWGTTKNIYKAGIYD